MKLLILFIASIAPLSAQTLAEAMIVKKDGDADKIWVEKASATDVRYRESEKSLNRKVVSLRTVSILFFAPAEYTTALDLFENRDYKGAQEAFKTAREKYKGTQDVPGNYSVLSGFYQMECARKPVSYTHLTLPTTPYV